MTLEQSLKALKSAFTSKAGEADSMIKEIAELKAQNADLLNEKAASAIELKVLSVTIAERDAALGKVKELTEALVASDEIKKQAVSQIESVGKKSASIAASVGVTPVEISAADAAGSKTPDEVWADYLEIKDPAEKISFYNRNRSQIIAHMGIK